jgi:hypothetical protein
MPGSGCAGRCPRSQVAPRWPIESMDDSSDNFLGVKVIADMGGEGGGIWEGRVWVVCCVVWYIDATHGT